MALADSQAREAAHVHPHGEILTLNIAGGDVSQIGAATGDAITDSQAEAVKRLVPFQSYVRTR
jgi:hypothetical protein